jgi:hypothetical protein
MGTIWGRYNLNWKLLSIVEEPEVRQRVATIVMAVIDTMPQCEATACAPEMQMRRHSDVLRATESARESYDTPSHSRNSRAKSRNKRLTYS